MVDRYPEVHLAAERLFLQQEVYGWDADIPATRITAFDRFSNRI
jgi:hypothetical protein